VDIGTLAVVIAEPSDAIQPSVVKVVGTPTGAEGTMRALYFTRSPAPYGPGPLFHHIGLYAYRRAALARFVSLPPSLLEQREKLEQLRALEAGMRIDVKRVDAMPMSVDTPADLEKVRAAIAASTRRIA
jgi:3-deoxy-manno-octulosonate cytidylyltransferase (CMP-KDO synthetase)